MIRHLSMRWTIAPGEEARLTPEGPGAAAVSSRGPLPVRVRREDGRGRAHPGTAVVLGRATYEVVSEEDVDGGVCYRLDPWPDGQVIRDRVVYGARLVQSARDARRRERWEPVAAPASAVGRWLLEPLVSLLPEPERRPLAARLGLDVLRGTILSALLSALVAGVLLPVGYVSFWRGELDAARGEISRAQREATLSDVGESGLAGVTSPLRYALRPSSLLLLYLAFSGGARLIHYALNRSPAADPLLALALGLARRLRQGSAARARLAELGPERPDRIVRQGAEVLVVAAREKEGWDTRATVELDGAFYRIASVEDRRDARWTSVAYRLTPVPAGVVFRNLVRYDGPALPAPLPPREEAPRLPPPVPRPQAPARAGSRPPVAAPRPPDGPGERSRWRVDEGEEARTTPEGPHAAVVESLGSLPFRVRSASLGVHHRPEFPGTCVVLGGTRYEVVAEEPLETGYRYGLDPWPRDAVLRDVVEYGTRLVKAAQAEREAAVVRERAEPYGWLIAPFVGLLPETRQELVAERYGLQASFTTGAGAAFEMALAATLVGTFGQGRLFPLLVPLVAVLIVPAVVRLVGALAWGEVGGSALWAGAAALAGQGRSAVRRFDPAVLPITRDAFWARLALPDRLEGSGDGVVVKAILPHLSWGTPGAGTGAPPVVRVGDDYWRSTARPPYVDKGRLVYEYHLVPMRDPDMRKDLPPPPRPDPRQYQEEVLDQVAVQWDDIFGVAPWLPTLLPRDVQERAFRGRGGATAGAGGVLLTALATAASGVWFVTGAGFVNVAFGLVLLADAGRRLVARANGDYAPSVLGFAFADYLVPERSLYHAHRDAERAALYALRGLPAPRA